MYNYTLKHCLQNLLGQRRSEVDLRLSQRRSRQDSAMPLSGQYKEPKYALYGWQNHPHRNYQKPNDKSYVAMIE